MLKRIALIASALVPLCLLNQAEAISISLRTSLSLCDGTRVDMAACTSSTPSAPVLGNVTVQGENTVILTLTTPCGASSAGTPPYTYSLDQTLVSAPSSWAEIDSNADFSNDTYAVGSLASGTAYNWRVACTDNDTNTSAESNTVSATTDGSAPSDTTDPTNATGQAFSNVTSTSMDFTWMIGTDNVAVDHQFVFCGLGDGMGSAVADSTFISANVGLAESYAVGGLTAEQEYYCRVCTYDAAGNDVCAARVFETTAASGGPTPSGADVGLTWENFATGALQKNTFYSPEETDLNQQFDLENSGGANLDVINGTQCDGTTGNFLRTTLDAPSDFRSELKFSQEGRDLRSAEQNWQSDKPFRWFGICIKLAAGFADPYDDTVTSETLSIFLFQTHSYLYRAAPANYTPNEAGDCSSPVTGLVIRGGNWRVRFECPNPNVETTLTTGSDITSDIGVWRRWVFATEPDTNGKFYVWKDDVLVYSNDDIDTFSDDQTYFLYEKFGLYSAICKTRNCPGAVVEYDDAYYFTTDSWDLNDYSIVDPATYH